MNDAGASGDPDRLITGDELALLPDHALTELIDGRIVRMSPAGPEHGRVESNIAGELRAVVRSQKLGHVMTGEVGVFTRRNPDNVRGADVAFISHERYRSRTRGRAFLDVAPELVVEVRSPDDGDLADKAVEYLAAGVTLVLVADPDDRTITAFRRGTTPRQYGMGESVDCSGAIPGFVLPVAAAFDE